MATTVQVAIDCADPAALARFWAEALGYEVAQTRAGDRDREPSLETTHERRSSPATGTPAS